MIRRTTEACAEFDEVERTAVRPRKNEQESSRDYVNTTSIEIPYACADCAQMRRTPRDRNGYTAGPREHRR